MIVERRAAIRQLCRELFPLRVQVVTQPGRSAIVTGGGVWHAVYRFDGRGLGCWDFFHESRNPGEYSGMVSDQLLTTNAVVERIRRMCT